MADPEAVAPHAGLLSFVGAMVWGAAVLAFSDWIAPTHLLVATTNLGGTSPEWLSWPVWACLLAAPALERLDSRRAIVRFQLLSGILILAASGLLCTTGALDDVWLPLAVGSAVGAPVAMLGWAIFAQSVPEQKRASRVFAAQLGLAAPTTAWTGGLLAAPGKLHAHLNWHWVWVIGIAAWGVFALILAGVTRATLTETDSDTADRTAPIHSPLPEPPAALYRDVCQRFLAIPGLRWIAAFQLLRALDDAFRNALEHQAIWTVQQAAAHGSEMLGTIVGTASLAALLLYPIASRFGIERCWRPLVALLGTVSLTFLLGSWFSPDSPGWTIWMLVHKRTLGLALSAGWILYTLRMVATERFVLSHYAWLSAMPPLSNALAQLLVPRILPTLDSARLQLCLFSCAILVIVAGLMMPLGPARLPPSAARGIA